MKSWTISRKITLLLSANWTLCLASTGLLLYAKGQNQVVSTLVLPVLLGAVALASILVMRRVKGALSYVAGQISASAEQISSAAAQVSSASQALAQGASEHAAALEETSASAQEITTLTEQNTNSARECSELMAQAQEIGKTWRVESSRLQEAVESINCASEEISKVLSVIDGIAFQTNILALNAAVEAARAGEAGAGFAVVADEVRNLARRSAEAAKTTSELVSRSVESAHEGRARLQALNDSLNASAQVRGAVKKMADLVSESSAEQSRGVEQIAQSIAQMDRATQSNSASAEENAAAAEELMAQSEAMKNVVRELSSLAGMQQT